MPLRELMRQIGHFYKPFQLSMILMFGFIAVQQALGMTQSWVLGVLINGLTKQRPLQYFVFALAIMLIAALLESTVVWYYREKFELSRIDFAIPRYISDVTIQKVFGLSISQLTHRNSGVTKEVIDKGRNAIQDTIRTLMYNVVPLILRLVFLVGALLWISVPLGLTLLAGIIIYGIVTYRVNIPFMTKIRQLDDLWNESSRVKNEALRNASLVIASAQENKIASEVDRKMTNVMVFGRDMWLQFALLSAGRNIIIQVTHVLTVGVALWEILHGKYGIGQLAVVFGWSAYALGNALQLSYYHREIMSKVAQVRKFFELLGIPCDVPVVEHPIRPDNYRGHIEFRDVTFTYRSRSYIKRDTVVELPGKSSLPALRDVSFTINPGETVAIVGESGAGKSTLVYGLLRAQDPDSGQILLDGNDLRLLDPRHFRKSFGVVDQGVLLFDHSLRHNLLFGIPEEEQDTITDDLLQGVCEAACIDRFEDKLERGLDTIIGERGIKLSGGERQRVGIARALLKNPAVLIFDEATSNLDAKNEELIRKAIRQASRGRTTIIIAHRFSTIRGVDKIFVMDHGQIIAVGEHTELITSCDQYKELIKTQLQQLNWVM